MSDFTFDASADTELERYLRKNYAEPRLPPRGYGDKLAASGQRFSEQVLDPIGRGLSAVGQAIADDVTLKGSPYMAQREKMLASRQRPAAAPEQQADPVAGAMSQIVADAKVGRAGYAAGVAQAASQQQELEDEAVGARVAAMMVPPPKPIAGNVIDAKAAPVKPNASLAPASKSTITPKQATTMYEAVSQMDPLGQAVIASALGVSPDVFRTPEETELEAKGMASALKWRSAMDDPNSEARKALDGGDYAAFTKMAMAHGAVPETQGISLLQGFLDADKKRESFGYDPKVYDQALIPVLSKSKTLNDAALAMVGAEDAPMVDQSGRVVEYDVGKVFTTPGAVEDVNRAVGLAAQDDLLGTRDMRPYVAAANLQFYDAIGTGLANSLQLDPATGIARYNTDSGGWWNAAEKDQAQADAVQGNLAAYIDHNRVSLVSSRRFSPEAVAAMDDMEVLSIALGKPRMAAIVGSNNETLLGDVKTILTEQTLFAPNGYATIASKSKGADSKPKSGDSQPKKKEK